ncbi:hypothetical protein J7643_17095 [bacterium]|nr:hypothetical protein [bacterium]
MPKNYLHTLGLLAATCTLLLDGAALAAPRFENSLTAGGLNIAPRYQQRVGDIDLSLQGGYVNYPAIKGAMLGTQLGLEARVTDYLQLIANVGSLNAIGLRGPLWSDGSLAFGWGGHYRSELYLGVKPGPGLSAPYMGTAPGSISQGGEFTLSAMKDFGLFTLYASPLVAMMSNRTAMGLAAGLDVALGAANVGYSLDYRTNSNPVGAGVQASEMQHGLGVRYGLTKTMDLLAHYFYTPGDTYGLANQSLLVGIGTHWNGPEPKPTPKPIPTPMPTPTPTATPAPVSVAPAPTAIVLQGRILNSVQPDAVSGKRLTLRLKRRSEIGEFIKVEKTTQTDATGAYSFRDLPPGEYQIFYKDEDNLPNTVDVAVSPSLKGMAGAELSADLDIGFDEQALQAAQTKDSVTVNWAARSNADTLYQGILRSINAADQSDLLSFPGDGTQKTSASFTVTPTIRSERLYYVIKYWKKGNAFNGSGFYGQSKPRTLKLAPAAK